jgi:glycosyltransferase involved in cell wall biosynthesis
MVMAVYNGERYLREAIDSILAQTLADFELIVVDDASTDATPRILDCYRDPRLLRLRNGRNLGAAASLNRGLAQARGEFVARLDADDFAYPERLARQVAYLDHHPQVGLLGTWFEHMDPEGTVRERVTRPITDTGIRWFQLFHCAFCHSSVMLRRDLLERTGQRYNETLRSGIDFDLWVRLQAWTRMAMLPEYLVRYRLHGDSITFTRLGEQVRHALLIASQQLYVLVPGLHLPLEWLDTMRRWSVAPQHTLPPEHQALGRAFVRILVAFGRQPGVDRAVVRQLRLRLGRPVLRALLRRQPWLPLVDGAARHLLPTLLQGDPPADETPWW